VNTQLTSVQSLPKRFYILHNLQLPSPTIEKQTGNLQATPPPPPLSGFRLQILVQSRNCKLLEQAKRKKIIAYNPPPHDGYVWFLKLLRLERMFNLQLD